MGKEARGKEEMLSAIVDNAEEAVVSVDADGRIIYANKATEELLGWSAGELAGKQMSILAVDAEKQKKQFMEAIKKGGARFETVRKAKDGSIIPVLMTVVPFKDEHDRLLFSSGIIIDIREQKKYEEKINHLNEVLRAIRNVNQLIVNEKDEKKLLKKTCEILVKVKGYTGACISFKEKKYSAGNKKECGTMLKFIEKKDFGDKIATYPLNESYLAVSPIIKDDIRAFLYVLHSKEFDDEELKLLQEISNDIAFALDAISKKKALKEKEILLSHVFESVQDGISVLDKDLTIRYVNSAMEKWYEKNMPLVGKKCYEAYHNRRKPCDPCPSLRAMKSGGMEMDIVPGLPGSEAEHIELFGYPMKDESGNVTGVVEFVRDITDRKKAEEKMKESEERFRGIFENTTVGMYRTTPEGKIVMANPFLVKLLGYESEEELKKRNLSKDEYYEPNYERDRFIKEIEKKGYFTGEQAWKRRDGSTIFVRESAVAVRNEKGKTLYYDGVVEDITELKKTHDKLVKARDDWEGIFNSISDPVIVLARDHTILDANPATLKALGKKREEVIGKKCFEFFHDIHKIAEGCPMETLLRSGHAETESMEMEALGGIFLITVSPVFEGGEITKVIHHARDITHLKQLMESLKESEERYRTLAESAEEAIIIHDMDGRISYINEYGAKLGGYSQKELVGKNVIEFVPPKYHEYVEKHREARAKGDDSIRKFEMELQVKKRRIPFEIISSVIAIKGERHILLIARDITERKEAEEALEESEERYRTLFENSLSAIAIHTIVTDKKGKPVDYTFVAVNDAFEKETGLKAKDVVGKRITEVLPDMDRTFIEEYGKIALNGGSSRFETYSAPLGKYLEISIFSPRRGQFVTVFKDISDRVKRIDDLKFLADSVAKLNEISSSDELYKFVAKSVKKLAGDAIVVVASHEPGSEFHVVQSVEGLGKNTSALLKLLGKDIVGMKLPILDPKKYSLDGEKLVKLPEDIHELSSGKIPKSAASAIKKLLGMENIYSIDIIRGENLFGNITIITRKGEKLKDKTLIETFIRQSSIAHQRVIAQQELVESEEKFRTFIEKANDGICIIKDGMIKFANPRLLEMGGYSEEDTIDQPFSKFISEESLKEVVERYRRRMAGEKVESVYETIIKGKDGGKVFAEFNVSLIDYEGGKAELVIVRDITERKKLMEALKESEEKYRGLIENAHDAIYIARGDGTFEYVNPSFEKLTGYTLDDIRSPEFSFWNIIHPDDVKMIEERKKARERGEEIPERYQFRIIAKDGSIKIVEVATVSIGEKGEVRVMGILRDETERIKAEKEMERVLEQEKEFKLATAHYFFNPIAIAKGYLDLTMEEVPEEQRKKIKSARHAITRVEEVVKNVTQRGEIHE